MVIDYMNAERLTEPAATLQISEISKIVQMDNSGTAIEDVNLLNEDGAITRAVPSLEFNGSEKPRELDDVVSDFKNRLPTIAWVGVGKPPFMWKHAVVITGISVPKRLVRVNEPYKGMAEEKTLDAFMEEWKACDNWLVRLILGRRENKKITEYPMVKTN